MATVSTHVAGGAIAAERAIPLESPDAFSHLYAQTHLTVFRYIYGLHGGPQEDVEDLAAEAYIRAWRARYSFEGDEEAALRWLLQIARHLVIDAHRQRGRRGLPDNIDDVVVHAQGHNPEEQTVFNEQTQLLGAMLHTLTTRQREIIVLRYILGWRVKRIADHLEMSPNTVSVTIRRTLNRLRREWPETPVQIVESRPAVWAAGRSIWDGFKR